MRAEEIKEPETIQLQHEELGDYEVAWLKFAENTTQIGRTCQGDVCCLYNITVSVPQGDAPTTVLSIIFHEYQKKYVNAAILFVFV